MVDTFSGVLKILLRRKISFPPGVGKHIFQRCLSVIDITCLGLSTVIGTGVFAILAFAAREYSGPSVVLSFLICSVASCLAGLCYAELCTRFPSGGSAYCYVYTALGELPAFLIGWSLLFEYHLAVTLSAKTLIQYMDSVSNGTVRSAFTLSLTYNSNDSIFLDVPSALLVLTLGFVLNRNLKSSCLYNNIFVFICLLVIGGIVLSSVYEADAENWTSGPGFFPNGIVGIFSGASICLFAFIGYDMMGSLSSECVNSSKMAFSISLTFLVALITCFTVSIAITLLVPFSLLDLYAPIVQAFVTRGLDGMQYFVILGATSGLMASTIASLLSLSRLLFYLSNDGLLFSLLSKYNFNTGVTTSATTIASLLCALTCLFLQTSTILHIMGTGTILSYMLVTLCIISLRYSMTERLPIEWREMLSRDTSSTDMRHNSHNISQSISDYYINNRLNQTNKLISQGLNEHGIDKTFCNNCIQSPLICDHQKESHLNCSQNYGSTAMRRTMSVEFVNQSFITSLSDLSFTTTQKPTQKTQNIVSVTILVMMAIMLAMAIITVHIPNVLPNGSQWCTQLLATLLFVMICICVIIIVRQPRHRPLSRYGMPCMPLLPICSIWLDIHLIVCLQYTSWLAFLIWTLFGVFVYMSFGVWNGLQASQSFEALEGEQTHDSQNINQLILIETSDDGLELNACDQIEVIGSSV